MSRSIKILTYNWHVPYICMLAETGHQLFVVEPETPSGRRKWDYEMRPPPSNVQILDDSAWRRGLDEDVFDLVICHNPMDLVELLAFRVPKILVLHNRLSTSLAMGDGLDKRSTYWNNVFLPLYSESGHIRFVAISAAKKSDWGLPARVIMPGVDCTAFDGYRGDVPKVLRVGNYLKERDLMMGFTQQESIVRDLPSTILGINPTIAGSRLSENFDDLRDKLRSHRVYLNTTVDPWEDGYNLAMLEAMATGMPVVTTANATSPIVDGVNGYVSDDMDQLHNRLEQLIAEPELARRLGAEARRTVMEKFPISRFVDSWNEMIGDTIRANNECRTVKRLGSARVRPRRILLTYTANPTTTAAYLERALRRDHEVVTCGPTISDDTLARWDMLAVRDSVRPHDIELDTRVDMRTALDRLPAGFEPDLLIWVESGINVMPPDFDLVECPKAGYFIDSHINLDWHVQWALQFDHVFVAQRAYLDAFRRAGCRSVHWLPLACDPEIHCLPTEPVEKSYEIGFVGSVTPHNPRRRQLIDTLAARVPVHIERCFLDEMVDVFNRSRVVFNTALRNDMNMRVFEALACGSLLLTDEAPGSGLEDFFKHDIHCAVYFDESLPDTARRYLDDSETRQRIADQGRCEALEHHTYRHRARQLLRTVFEGTADRYEPDVAAMVRQVPQTASSILVAGRSAPDVARALKKSGFGHVAGVESDLTFTTPDSRAVFDEIIEQPAAGSQLGGKRFDAVVLVDMIENCFRPGDALAGFKPLLAERGRMIISTRNARFIGNIESLVEGRWMCADGMRFGAQPLTFSDVKTLLARAGMQPANVVAVAPPGAPAGDANGMSITFGGLTIDGLNETDLQQLRATHFILTAVVAADESVVQAEAAYRRGEYKEALRNLESMSNVTSTGPYFQATAILRGRCHEALGDWQSAEAAYRSAMNETETSVAALLGLARISIERGDEARAADLVANTDGLELEVADRVDRGLLFLRINEPARASAEFRDALDVDAVCRDAIRGLIRAATIQNEFEQILSYVDRYLGLRGADVDTLYEAAVVDVRVGRVELAVERFQTVLMFNPEHTGARRYLEQLQT